MPAILGRVDGAPGASRLSPAAALCAAIAALTLVALGVQPQQPGDEDRLVWRIDLALQEISAAGLRWALSIPGVPPEPEEALDGPLLWPAPLRPATVAAAPERALVDLRSYTLEAVRDGSASVPRLLLDRLPSLLTRVESAELRKRLFIKALLPTVLAENERVLASRSRLVGIAAARAEGISLSGDDAAWIADIAQTYGTERDDVDELLRRIDAVPPSLALAQAALESGWGTSRGAQQAHSMFGHMMFAGIGDTARITLRPFPGLGEAVAAYVHNLNTHHAYAPFRERRTRARATGQQPDGHALAGELLRYSERGHDYVRDVRTMIRSNRLEAFDRARLDG